MQDLRFQYLQLQEDLIKVQLDKEKLEETLRSEIHFLRDQADAEQHCKRQLEDALSQEVHGLRRQLGEGAWTRSRLAGARRNVHGTYRDGSWRSRVHRPRWRRLNDDCSLQRRRTTL